MVQPENESAEGEGLAETLIAGFARNSSMLDLNPCLVYLHNSA